MHKIISLILSAGMLLSLSMTAFSEENNTITAPINKESAENRFSDIRGHWAEETIKKWQYNGIISGYDDGTFRPDNYVTRTELAKIITVAFSLEGKSELSEYDDIDSSEWYYPYVECAAKYLPLYPLPVGYTTNLPFSDNRVNGSGFLPEVKEIRVHLAETLVKIKKDKENLNIEIPPFDEVMESVQASFSDSYYIHDIFAMHGTIPDNVQRMFNYTYLANEFKLMQGNTNGEFLPYNNVTRAELITVIDRMISE